MTRFRLFSLALTAIIALAGLGIGTAAASVAGSSGFRDRAQPPPGLLLSWLPSGSARPHPPMAAGPAPESLLRAFLAVCQVLP